MATANYSWVIPTVDGSNGVWGELLNDIFDSGTNNLDDLIKAISDVADAALPAAGGTLTGTLKVLDTEYTVVAKGNISGAVTFDLATGNMFTATITAEVTSVTFTNVPAEGCVVTLRLVNSGAYAFGTGTKNWPGGSPPSDLATAGTHIVTAVTADGGTTWDMAAAMLLLS